MNTIKTNIIGAVQGDVPLLRVDSLTPNGKATENRIVAVGESTGHHHQIVGECERYEVQRSIGGNLFRGLEVVVIDGNPVTLEHTSGGEHFTVEMTSGIYFIPAPGQQQVEYDGENERRVMD